MIKGIPSVETINGEVFLFSPFSFQCPITEDGLNELEKYIQNIFPERIDVRFGRDMSYIYCYSLGMSWREKIIFDHSGIILTVKRKKTVIPYIVENETVHYNVTKVIEHMTSFRTAYLAKVHEDKLKMESKKYNSLYISGKLGELGFPNESVTFENLNTTTKVFIPVDRKSVVTKSYIKIDIRTTKKVSFDVTGDTKVDLSFVKETSNRKDRVVPFENIRLDDALTILESFKKVYFKDENDQDTE